MYGEIKQALGPTQKKIAPKPSACAGEKLKVPQDMKDANIITLYKNKVDRSDCNNYRGITLLSIVGKLFARITLKRLQVLAESTTDMVFSLS